MIRSSALVAVNDASGVADARRHAQSCAEALRMSETAVGKAGLVATELATNLIKHAGGGSIAFASDEEQPHMLSVISMDKGPGIANVTGAMRDGFSTAGSHGNGLGAIQRAACMFDIWTVQGKGTVLTCRIEDEARRPRSTVPERAPRVEVAGLCVAMPGEEEPGDAWTAMRGGDDQLTIVVADGLGHGPMAAAAAREAIRSVRTRPGREVSEMMLDAHGALRATRGAAMAVARIHPSRGVVEFVGAGNIVGVVMGDAVRRTVSYGGIVGHEMRKTQTFSYPWLPTSILI
ncbi:MAG TPA: ATP-binding protein, partial [Thermoanaerobaculia bacterium]|nr:ATP-binding protein [Thermoanaerobaculia bacterium]